MGKSIYDFGFELKKEMSFGEALRLTFKKYHLKVERVANEAFMDKSLIYKYWKNSSKPNKETLVKLLLSMRIPFDESEKLLRRRGYSLDSNNADIFYRVLLENSKALCVLDANDMIDLLNEEEGRIAVKPFDLN